MKAADCARLLNVERLACRRIRSGVDHKNVTDAIVRRERLSARTADVPCADDRNSRHEPVGYSTGLYLLMYYNPQQRFVRDFIGRDNGAANSVWEGHNH